MRAFISEHPATWTTFFSWAEFCFNSSYHSAIRIMLFQALYVCLPPVIPPYTQGSSSIQALDDLLTERDGLLHRLNVNILQAQNRMKQRVNCHRREVEFSIGDWVFLRLQSYMQHSVSRRFSPKLAKRFFGPFQNLELIGPVAYKLQLSSSSRIHPMFYVALLKPFKGT